MLTSTPAGHLEASKSGKNGATTPLLAVGCRDPVERIGQVKANDP